MTSSKNVWWNIVLVCYLCVKKYCNLQWNDLAGFDALHSSALGSLASSI